MKNKKNIVSLLAFALMFGIGMAGASVYADISSVNQNTWDSNYMQGNYMMQGWDGDNDDFVKFHDDMYDLMYEYGMGSGMMGGGFGSWMR